MLGAVPGSATAQMYFGVCCFYVLKQFYFRVKFNVAHSTCALWNNVAYVSSEIEIQSILFGNLEYIISNH
jgi:hypothetical protein